MSDRRPTRRHVAGLGALVLALLAGRTAGAQQAPTPSTPLGDRGIGGTGYVPFDRSDQGIGGTGVVGTIRRFGSIVVNDMRIGYGPDVDVTIDGVVARPADLRLGQVVRTAAMTNDAGLVTRAIAVVSEVVGPVEYHRGDRLTVLGQDIDLGEMPQRPLWRIGRRLRVSGVRRPDGVVVASLVEPTRDRIDRVAGLLTRSNEGTLRIGGLVLRHVDPTLAGQRIIVRGRLRRGVMVATLAESETALLAGLMADRLSLETFLERRGSQLHLGSGLAVDDAQAVAVVPDNTVVRAFVSASVRDGRIVVEHVNVVERGGHQEGGQGTMHPGGVVGGEPNGTLGGPMGADISGQHAPGGAAFGRGAGGGLGGPGPGAPGGPGGGPGGPPR